MNTVLRMLQSFTGTPWPIVALGVGETVALAFFARLAIKRRQPTAKTTGRTERVLLLAAMLFCSLVLAAFVIGTYEGSTAFAKNYLGWTDWRQIIPWGALDAAGFGFGLFVIRAVVLGRSPIRARRVVYLCAGFSALLQMIQGGQHHRWQAGLFLAFIAAMGAMVLHTVVDQLRDDTDESGWHRSPPFGLRWITFLPNTLCAWLAWTNHPAPEEISRPTVANAVANLERVRTAKTTTAVRTLTDELTFPRFSALTPWRRAPIFTQAITDLRSEQAEQIAKLAAEQTALIERADLLADELDRTRAEIAEQIRAAVQAATEQTEQTVREQIQRETRRRTEQDRAETVRAPRPERVDPHREQRRAGEQVARIHSDEQITDALWDAYREQMEQTGQPLSGYRVRVDGGCAQRQADRVLDLLAVRWAGHQFRTAPKPGEHTEQASEETPDRPLDREAATA